MRQGGEGWVVGPGPEGGGGSVDFAAPEKVAEQAGRMADVLSFGD